jgi:hypothetical protein
MGMRFIGGPYDGMEIDQTLLNRHAELVPVSGDLGMRLFMLMPPRASWEKILRGEAAKKGPLQPYERVFNPEGAHFEAVPAGAFDQALLEAKLKVHPRARTALAALSERDQRAVVQAAAALQNSDPSSWPHEAVERLGGDQPVYLLRVSPDLRAFLRVLESGGLELFDIMREDTLRLFLERYRAGSKVG